MITKIIFNDYAGDGGDIVAGSKKISSKSMMNMIQDNTDKEITLIFSPRFCFIQMMWANKATKSFVHFTIRKPSVTLLKYLWDTSSKQAIRDYIVNNSVMVDYLNTKNHNMKTWLMSTVLGEHNEANND